MNTWQRRTVGSLLGLAVLMLVYALIYDYGMSAFENEPKSFLHSLQVVVETFTTTGFGSDTGWQSPAMNVLVIVMDLTGVALIFLALPVVVFPLLDETLSRSAPTTIEDTDHVVICSYTPRGRALIEELDSRDVSYVVIERDRDRADDLHEDGVRVVYGDPESPETLAGVDLGAARALVADASDEGTPRSRSRPPTPPTRGSSPSSRTPRSPTTTAMRARTRSSRRAGSSARASRTRSRPRSRPSWAT